jgi:hypothetical protein
MWFFFFNFFSFVHVFLERWQVQLQGANFFKGASESRETNMAQDCQPTRAVCMM